MVKQQWTASSYLKSIHNLTFIHSVNSNVFIQSVAAFSTSFDPSCKFSIGGFCFFVLRMLNLASSAFKLIQYEEVPSLPRSLIIFLSLLLLLLLFGAQNSVI